MLLHRNVNNPLKQKHVGKTRILLTSVVKPSISNAECHVAVLAEWLRRLTRNQIPSGSVGSSPADCEVNIFMFEILM